MEHVEYAVYGISAGAARVPRDPFPGKEDGLVLTLRRPEAGMELLRLYVDPGKYPRKVNLPGDTEQERGLPRVEVPSDTASGGAEGDAAVNAHVRRPARLEIVGEIRYAVVYAFSPAGKIKKQRHQALDSSRPAADVYLRSRAAIWIGIGNPAAGRQEALPVVVVPHVSVIHESPVC